jgi:hypothetical protein
MRGTRLCDTNCWVVYQIFGHVMSIACRFKQTLMNHPGNREMIATGRSDNHHLQ